MKDDTFPMAAMNDGLEVAFEVAIQVAKEIISIVHETGVAELLHSALNPMTDSMVSYGVTATAITFVTLVLDSHLKGHHKKQTRKRAIRTPSIKEQEFRLKGRLGQIIGRVKMNKEQTIDAFIADLESLNQINRGRHAGPLVRFEVHRFHNPFFRRTGNFTHYSTFLGSLLFGEDSHEVKGIAKIQKRGKMIYSEVEFDSDLGHFRLGLPHFPGAIHDKDLKFIVDIGCKTQNLVG